MRYINKTRFYSLFLTLTLLFTGLLSYARTVSSDISDAVVRLHIIANSDSTEDQALKLKVRDRILNEGETPNDALSLINDNLDFIQAVAHDEVLKHGFSYPVTVSTGSFSFPTQSYGDIILPAGKYNALRIQIGESKGQNWWCVVYPPLCFTGATGENVRYKSLILEKIEKWRNRD